jgi:DNA ligase-associated metallophosphoesterase
VSNTAARARAGMAVALGGTTLRLLPQRAAWWAARATLVIADAHFGKAAAFRARGVPVPRGTTADNLARLDALVATLAPERIVFLGDLFHAREAHAPTTIGEFQAWRDRHRQLELVLVEGNHDAAAGPPPATLSIRSVEEPWCVDGMAFCHVPQWVPGKAVLAGHLHPAVRLSGRAGDGVRLPCFWLRAGLTILPAFGAFTGGALITRDAGDRVLALTEDRLYEVPQRVAA